MSIAINKPSNIWALASALSKSNFVLLKTTSLLCLIYSSKHCFKVNILGSPSTKASIIIPNVSCIWVCLYNWFRITWGLASLFNSITILTLSFLSDSSLTSDIPSIFLSFTNSSIFMIKLDLFTWYGNDETTILCLFPCISSISASALTVIFPLPVVYASFIPSFPNIIAPVGKSGPFIIDIKSSFVTLSSSITFIAPFITSVKLWGGIFVAIPTAIPDEPFIKSAGTFAGNTVGSCNLSS